MGPGVGYVGLEAMGEPLVERSDQRVVPTADAVGELKDRAEIRVRPSGRIVDLGGVCRREVGRRAREGVGERGTERRSIDILGAV